MTGNIQRAKELAYEAQRIIYSKAKPDEYLQLKENADNYLQYILEKEMEEFMRNNWTY